MTRLGSITPARVAATDVAARTAAPLPSSAPALPVAPPSSILGPVLGLALAGAALVGGLGTWTATAELESAVLAPGAFEVDGRLRMVQHLEGGIVTEIAVREGQHVEAGEVLVRLDPTMTDAQIGIIEAQLVGALAHAARLDAEAAGRDALAMTPELEGMLAKDASYADVIDAQRGLLGARRDNDGGEAAILTEQLRQAQNGADRFAAERAAIEERLAISLEDLASLEDLLAKGLTTNARLRERRDMIADLRGRLQGAEARAREIADAAQETRQRMRQIALDRQSEIAEARQAVREEMLDLRQRLAALEDTRRRLDVRAPAAGRVFRLDVATVGEVVAARGRLMEIVPDDARYVVAARVRPQDIDEVAQGQPAKLRLSAYSFRETAPIEGTVRHVSPDRIVDPDNGQAYFAIEVVLDEASLGAAGDVVPVPGMPVEAMLRTGSQTVLTYLLDPLLQGLEMAMIEGS